MDGLSDFSYQYPFLNPGGLNAFVNMNLKIALPIKITNIVHEPCVGQPSNCGDIISYDNIVSFGYVNTTATEYSMYIGDSLDICESGTTSGSDIIYSYTTTITNTSLNSKIHIGCVTYELIKGANNDNYTHIAFYMWKALVCPAQLTRSNEIRLKRYKRMVMKLTPDIAINCNQSNNVVCIVPDQLPDSNDTDCPPKQYEYATLVLTLGGIQYAKNFLINYLQSFEWNYFDMEKYNSFRQNYNAM